MVRDSPRLELVVFSISTSLNRVKKIPICVVVNSVEPRVLLFT